MPDEFANVEELMAPARNAFAITPHATTALAEVPKGIHCNVAGDIACRFVDDSADVTLTLVAGAVYPYRLSHVRVAGTTATIVGLR